MDHLKKIYFYPRIYAFQSFFIYRVKKNTICSIYAAFYVAIHCIKCDKRVLETFIGKFKNG